MYDLTNIRRLVKSILEQDERCRNSDSLLYLKVITAIADEKGINLHNIPVTYFLTFLPCSNFPPFETVRRSRQLLQRNFPELKACEKVQKHRAELEQDYRDFARGLI